MADFNETKYNEDEAISMSHDIEDEMDRDAKARAAVDDLAAYESDEETNRPTSELPSGRRSRATSVGSAHSGRSARSGRRSRTRTADSEADASQIYGDDARSIKSLKMAGSRPPSRSGRHERSMSGQSTATSLNADDRSEGYLFLHDSVDPALKPSFIEADGKKPDLKDGLAAPSVHGSYVSGGKDTIFTNYTFTGPAAGPPIDYIAQSDNFGPEQAWYFLRSLIGLEIAHEARYLWKLDDLSPMSPYDIEEETLRDGKPVALQAPILRYLIKNFLLTLPFVRDTTSLHDQSNPLSGRPESYLDDNATYTGDKLTGPVFWVEGLQPLMRAVHNLDLSEPVDQGRRSLSSILIGYYGKHMIERFIGTGLKLSSGETIGEVGAKGHRHSMLNPLINLQIPRQPGAGATVRPRSFGPGHVLASPGSPNQDGKKRTSRGLSMFFNRSGSRSSRPETPQSMVSSAPRQSVLAAPMTAAVLPAIADDDDERSSIAHSDITEPAPQQAPSGLVVTDDATDGAVTPRASPGPEVKLAGSASSDVIGGPEEPHKSEQLASSNAQEHHATIASEPAAEAESEGEEADVTYLPERTSSMRDPALARESNVRDSSSTTGGISAWVGGLFSAASANTAPIQEEDTKSPKMASSVDGTDTEGDTDYESIINASSDAGDDHVSAPAAPPIRGLTDVTNLQTHSNGYGSADDTSPTLVWTEGTKHGQKEIVPVPGKTEYLPERGSSMTKSGRLPAGSEWSAPMVLPDNLHSVENIGATNIDPEELARLPISVPLVPKSGHPWPWGAPVPFWKGTPVHRVEWGGFEADVIGVRKSAFGHSFIIRVRRPGRLDEYVLRDEAQFRKYLAALDKEFPVAHVRRIPSGKIRPEDDVVDGQALAATLAAKEKKPKAAAATSSAPAQQPAEPTPARTMPKKQSYGGSRLSLRLKEAARDGVKAPAASVAPDARTEASARAPATEVSRATGLNTLRAGSAASPSVTGVGSAMDQKAMPAHDALRRALRAWLRDTLSVRTVGHSKETAQFLLLGPISPKEADVKDIRRREVIDEARKAGRVQVAQGAAERTRAMQTFWHEASDEVINGDGLLAISEALRQSPTIEGLPTKYQKSIEWMRMGLAQGLYDLLCCGEHSAALFTKVKGLHAAFPWFLVRQAFKIPSTNLMAKALQDILLAKPFGNKSLLQRTLATVLEDDPTQLHQQIEACRARISSSVMCDKLTAFVYSSRDNKEMVRHHAEDNNLELVVAIVRGADMPRLDKFDLERILKAGKQYRAFMKKSPTPVAKATQDNPSIRLIFDLQIFLRLISRERDAQQIRGLMTEDSTAEALEVIIQPIFELIKRTYKTGNMSNALGDLQRFLDQLIIIVDALRSRIQDPQKAVRILARLLSRHQQALYTFLHFIHRDDTVIEEFFQWFWTITVFLRRGLAETIDLDALLPTETNDRNYLLDEIDDVVEYQRKKRTKQYEVMCRRYAGEIDGDDPVIVEGDGSGKSRLTPLVEPEIKSPRLVEIPRCIDAFRQAVSHIFSV
ncbi:uncharacterized protein L969DRAFT_46989 [Mixia osmundae IAM 14324]|uniref:PX domain-containing protein n=1 Tax=Mixia osmundae (strain CBS 9802 / IAM 14324 / JCM 22182 / KY 12970) TaxID=764103 RepID=G7E648_MIXOS|nr:uncharacterized protein L969DRAFT_46989 [Mixia osmundae IAM 14324]KEI40538.1 hypothetical protein L969DRAFT_46989 [Mixia osmundae IAM 14324]GAA98308.1 hypothetical protein E5Q_04992 [Mixia osmundae IAM 14324]